VPVPAARRSATTRPSASALVGAVLVAIGAALLGASFAGALAPQGLLDPGALVRWAEPASTLVMELAATLAIGAAALCAFVLPRREPARSSTWSSAMVLAAGAAGAWTLAGLAHLVLTYVSIAGTPVDSPAFGPEIGLFVTSVSLGRTLLAIVVVAALTCVLALMSARPTTALLTLLLAAAALAMQSQTGHVAGSLNHDLASGSMFLHLAGATIWIGGLAALSLVAHRLGQDLATSVSRYSRVAGWCYAGVAVSGTVNAALRLGGWSGLSTRYGVLLLVKVALFVLLGVIGLAHRRLVVTRLDDGAGSTVAARLFWRLVAVELLVMGAVSGVAVALGSSEPPTPQVATGELTPAQIVTGHPLPPSPTLELWLTSFRWDLLPALGCLAGVIVYLRWVARLRARGDRWPVSRTLSMLAATVLLAWTTSGGPAVYGHVLFSAHMVQHMLLIMVVPIFVALCAPVTLAARALPVRADGSWGPREWVLGIVHSRWVGLLANPVVAALNFVASMFVFYFTDLFALTLTTYIGHLLMVAHFTLVGYLFINGLIGVDPGPRRPSHALRLLLLFAAMAFHAFFGLALVTDEALLVPEWFGLLGRAWGPSALADQRIGGSIAWGISEIPMLVLAVAIALSWTREDERTARRTDRAADRDGDVELAEYNAMLARLGRRAD
jgi:cytochrome c oxidase assembly factor CtaG/putative copper export protein